jgi:hypothetical protein
MIRQLDFYREILRSSLMSYKLYNTYQAQEAKEMIDSFIKTKVDQQKKLNTKRNHSSRLAKQNQTLNEIYELLDLAETNNWLVKIDSEIKVQLIKPDNT